MSHERCMHHGRRKVYSRDVCRSCYAAIMYEIRTGKLRDWQHAVELGRCGPARTDAKQQPETGPHFGSRGATGRARRAVFSGSKTQTAGE